MSESATDVERLLSLVLQPVEPPETLSSRVEDTLSAVTAAAAGELEDWDPTALRDPRNWVRPNSWRPVVAVGVGTAAGTALVLLEMRRRKRPSGIMGLADDVRSKLRI